NSKRQPTGLPHPLEEDEEEEKEGERPNSMATREQLLARGKERFAAIRLKKKKKEEVAVVEEAGAANDAIHPRHDGDTACAPAAVEDSPALHHDAVNGNA